MSESGMDLGTLDIGKIPSMFSNRDIICLIKFITLASQFISFLVDPSLGKRSEADDTAFQINTIVERPLHPFDGRVKQDVRS